ncbi:MAG TPA: hypothetical protein VF612_08520 [Jatrophihabitans sp.]|jgi:hypothetical protein|uniref:hypothetical protein n=1 Tax=Jatrophihabitans sp. TaxID=1932789 RepID=UPI002F032B08
MIYVLAFMVLLLTAVMIMFFAMLGELYSRVGPAPAATGPLQEAKVGQRPQAWPRELAPLATATDAVLLVLSTSCASCVQVAGQLRDRFEPMTGYVTGVVLSTADPDRAEAFVREHGLPRDSVYVDVEGAWVTTEFGVLTSPSALILRDGQLSSALVFTDVAALQSAVAPAT